MKYIACIGNFDGVHLGHQKLIERTVELAADKFIPAAITFDPDPKTVYTNDKYRKHLTTLKQKEEIMYSLGIQELILINFTKEISYLTPDTFIEYFLNRFNLDTLVCGPDYSFGHKGIGKVDYLINSALKNFKVDIVDDVLFNNHKINSTEIISFVKQGDFTTVNYLLGRIYKANVDIKNKHIIDSKNVLPEDGDFSVEIDKESYQLNGNYISYRNGNTDIYFPEGLTKDKSMLK
ncbi:MAG: FAD synthetase family protein [Erysipelotrichia bacterium]|nr:FAD synthetase family protein [Erysipelotrichia bacterium]